MAGDGQMDPNDLEDLVSGLEFADHVKGNRFHHDLGTKNMLLFLEDETIRMGVKQLFVFS